MFLLFFLERENERDRERERGDVWRSLKFIKGTRNLASEDRKQHLNTQSLLIPNLVNLT